MPADFDRSYAKANIWLGCCFFFFITGSRLDIWRRCAGTVLDERSGNNKLSPDAGRVNYLWLTKGKQFCWIMTFVESDQRSCETNAGEKKRSNVKCRASPWVTLPSHPHLIQLDTRNTFCPQWRSAVIYFRFDSSLCASQKFIYI